MARQIIGSAWLKYREIVVPKDAGSVQLRETRCAFYGGAQALFYSMLNSLDPGPMETEEDLALMADIAAELQAFGEAN